VLEWTNDQVADPICGNANA